MTLKKFGKFQVYIKSLSDFCESNKIDWSVWKRTAKENDNENAADYVIFNNFSSKAQYDKTMSNFNYNQAVAEMKMGLD